MKRSFVPSFIYIRRAIVVIFIFILGYSISGLFIYDPIPFAWSSRMSEFALTHIPFNTPFFSPLSCPDFRTAVGLIRKTWGQEIDYGFINFSLDPQDDEVKATEAFLNNGIDVINTQGAIKWRYQAGQAYAGIPIVSEWTTYFRQDEKHHATVKELASLIPVYTEAMEARGFQSSLPNQIPYYQYPTGEYAQKFGFTKGKYLYQVTITEDGVDDFTAGPEDPTYASRRVEINCAHNIPELQKLYEKYFALPHAETDETSVFFTGKHDQVSRFSLLYPGGEWEQLAHEYYKDGETLTPIVNTNNFVSCSIFESKKTGDGFTCYRPEKKEFDVVTY